MGISSVLLDRPDASTKGARSLWYPAATIHKKRMKGHGEYNSRTGLPRGAIVHFTAGRGTPEDCISYGITQGYNYMCIGRDGQVVQASPLNRWGSHAGRSSHKDFAGGVSDELVGIEIISAGRLTKVGTNQYKSWFGTYYGANEVREITKPGPSQEPGFYHRFTPEQEESLDSLLLWLKRNDPTNFQIAYILGHDEVSLSGKNDPGGALSMQMKEYRNHLRALWSKEKG